MNNNRKKKLNKINAKLLFTGLLFVLFIPQALAGPQGGAIVSGNGSIQMPDTHTTLITQQSQSLSINWESLNIAADELLKFEQPNSQAAALNYILDQRPSEILGRIDANGRVYLMNPNGIIFGESARINVGGLVAGSMQIDRESLNDRGEFSFVTGNGLVENAGEIIAAEGGSVALVGQAVSNNGQIAARLGKIHLLSADAATLSFDADGLIQFNVARKTLENSLGVESALSNKGTLQADGGYVVLEAQASNNIFTNVINNEGLIQANRISHVGGVIRLEGQGGNVIHSGDISAIGLNDQSGGDVSIMGSRVGVFANATVNAFGATGGGNIAIGGQRKGAGENIAEFTQVAADTVIRADAINSGQGGEVVLWANDTTWANGTISATGGATSGDAGFIEISGKQGLVFNATIDLSANNGGLGTLLFDPTDITINDQATVTTNDGLLPDLSNGTQGAGTFAISESGLEALGAASNLVLEATNNIVINDLTDNVLAFAIDSSGSISMSADTDSDGSGSFSMNTGDTISTQGSSLSISGAGITLGSLNTDGPASDGVITVSSTASVAISASTSGTQTMSIAIDTDADGAETLTLAGSLAGGTVNLLGGSNGGDTLIGPNLPTSWTVTSLNTGTLAGANFSNFPNLTGGTGDDTFTVSGIGSIAGLYDGGAHTTGDTVNYSAATGVIAVTLGTSVSNIESLIGGGADFSIIAANVPNTWVITAQNDGSVAGVTFTDFSGLTGGTDTDDFTLSGGSITGTINGGGNTDSLTANNTTNNWSILSANGGSVDSVFAFTSIENLTGGTGADGFVVNTGSVSGIIDGGAGNDSLAPDNVANTWNVTANDAGTVTGVGSFLSIENLNGRNDTDDFNVADGFAITGTIDGGGGTDTIDLSLQTGAVLVDLASGSYANLEKYTGNGANSSFVGDDVVNVWSISGFDDGVNDGTVGTVSFVNFAAVTGGTNSDSFSLSSGTLSGALNGGAGSDTLIADNASNVFSINGADSGVVTGVGSFAGIENLTGNAGTDNFNFGVAGSLSGVINGSTGVDTVNYSAVAGPINVVMGAAGFSNVEVFVGNNTNSTLTGANIVNNWIVTGPNDGTINTTIFTDFNNLTGGTSNDTFSLSGGTISGAIDGGIGTNVLVGNITANTWNIVGADSGNVTGAGSFSNITNLTGNSGADDYVFAVGGSLTGVINGASGADSVSFAAKPGAVSVDLANTNFVSIETFIGNNTDSTLLGINAANTWSITGVNDGTVGIIAFTDFNKLDGNNGVDDFILSPGGSVTGTITGGTGADSIQGYSTGASWNITGVDIGNLSGVPAFSGIESLLGGNGVDAFIYSNGSSFSGSVNGGAGTDSVDFSAELGVVSIDLGASAYFNIESFVGNGSSSTITGDNTSNTWTITGANSGTVNTVSFSGFNNLAGNNQTDQFFVTGGTVSTSINGGAGSDYLRADNVANTWTIVGLDQGSVTGIAAFSQIENLTGNNQLDAFVFGNGTSISGIVDGAAGTDSADFSAEAGSISISLGVSAYTNIESFIGNNIDSTLVGPVSSNAWNITGNNDGTVGGVSFTNFTSLTGNVSSDNFQFQDGSTITGVIDGAAGLDTVDLSLESGVVNVVLGGAGYLNVENFTGNNLTSTIAGDNIANTWVVTGTNAGNVGAVNFTGFNNLLGNANTDGFSLNGGNISGSVNGGGGVDSITADSAANAWTISTANAGAVTGISSFSNIENLLGSSGADSFVFADGSSISGSVDGGGGAGVNSVNQAAQTGIVNIVLGGSGFSNIDTFTGNGSNSTLVGENIVSTWNISGLNTGTVGAVSFSNINNLRGGTANDGFVIGGGSLSGQIDGGAGAGSDFIQADNITNSWNITGVDVGNVTGVGSFVGIETLTGNASVDTFIFAGGTSFSGVMNGAGGTDTVDLSSQTGVVTATLATSQYQNIENFIGNNTSSTLVGDNVINSWLITGGNAGSINSINFSGFNNLSGNASADTFTLSGGSVSGNIDGGSGNDTIQGDNINTTWNVLTPDAGNLTGVNAFLNIDNLLGGNTTDIVNIGSNVSGSVDGGGGNDFINVTGLVSIGGSLIGNSGSDTLTGPTQDSNWLISAADSGSVNSINFSQIETLAGNTGNDVFSVSNSAVANISGGISGGAGTDELQVDYIDASTRTIVFDGGAGTDSITVTGSGTGLSNSYVFGPASGQVDITTTSASNTQTINGTGIESVADTLTADNMVLQGSANADVMTLSPGTISGAQPITFQISAMPTLQFSNKNNLSLDAGAGADSLQINGTVQLAGDMTISAETIIEGSGGVLVADTLTFNQVNTIGSSPAVLATSVNTLQINGPTVDAYVSEANGFAISVGNLTGVLDVSTSTGDITSAGSLTISGTSAFTVGNGGSVVLDNAANQFSGTPTFSSAGTINNISLTDNSAVDIQALSLSGNLTLLTTGPVTQSGALNIQGSTSVNAGANSITLNNAANDFVGDLALQNSGTANTTIIDVNAVRLAASSIGSGNLSVSATDISQTGAMVQAANAGTATFTATSGSIALANGANDFTGTVFLNNSGAGNTALTASNGLSLGSSVSGGGDMTITASGDISLSGTTTSSGGDILITANTGDIQLGRVNSGTGRLLVSASGDVIGNNSPITDPNLSSQKLEIISGATIGDFNNPISVRVPTNGTSFFIAGTGSANIIGLTGTVLGGSVIVNDVSATNAAVGQGQSVSFLEQDLIPSQDIVENPLYSVSGGGLHLIDFPRNTFQPQTDDEDELSAPAAP